MKLLMIQLPTSHLGAGEKVYPLGLSRLSSLVPGHIDKKGLDMNLCPDPWKSLTQTLKNFGPDAVALSFRNLDPLAGHQISYLSSLKTAGALIRHLLPGSRIIAGGPGFSLFARRLMAEVPQIDFGLAGEGEPVFKQLLAKKVEHRQIPGLLWRDEDMVIANPPGPGFPMDDLPAMDVETFCPADYMGSNAYVAAMGIEGKRGCDLRCGYCLYPFLGGACTRLRPPKKIVDEMQELKEAFNIRMFHFTDGVINRPEDHFQALCRELIQRKINVSWTGFFREDSLTSKNLDLAMNAGLAAVYFSADALTGKGLSLLSKQLSRQDILSAARLTAQKKILTMCHFLINLPGENPGSVAAGEQMLDRLLDIHASAGNLGAVIFNHVRLYPGAPLTRKLVRSGLLDPDIDLLYPVYYNPPKYNHLLHQFEAKCHQAGVFSRFGFGPGKETS